MNPLIIVGIGIFVLLSPVLFSTFLVEERMGQVDFSYEDYKISAMADNDFKVFDKCADLSTKNNVCANTISGEVTEIVNGEMVSCPIYTVAFQVTDYCTCTKYRCRGIDGGSYRRSQRYPCGEHCGPYSTTGGFQKKRRIGCAFDITISDPNGIIVYDKQDLSTEFGVDLSFDDNPLLIVEGSSSSYVYSNTYAINLLDFDVVLTNFHGDEGYFDEYENYVKTSCGFDIKIKDSFQEIDAVSVSSNRFSSIFTSWNNLIQAILRWFK